MSNNIYYTIEYNLETGSIKNIELIIRQFLTMPVK